MPTFTPPAPDDVITESDSFTPPKPEDVVSSDQKTGLVDQLNSLRKYGAVEGAASDILGGVENSAKNFSSDLINTPNRLADLVSRNVGGPRFPDLAQPNTPIVSIPEPTGNGYLSGAGKLGAQIVSGLTTPESLTTLPAAADSLLVRALFGAQMGHQLPEQVANAATVLGDPNSTPAEKVVAAGNPVVAAAMIAGLAAHKSPKPATQPKEPNASGELTTLKSSETIGNGKSNTDPNQLQKGSHTELGDEGEASTSASEASRKQILQASPAWLEAVKKNNPEAFINSTESMLGEPMDSEMRKTLLESFNDGGAEIRASSDNGKNSGSKATNEGTRPSQERGQSGQQTGESSSGNTIGAFQNSQSEIKNLVKVISSLQSLPESGEKTLGIRALQHMLSKKTQSLKEKENYALKIASATRSAEPEVRPPVGEEAPLRQQGKAPGTQPPVEAEAPSQVQPPPLRQPVEPPATPSDKMLTTTFDYSPEDLAKYNDLKSKQSSMDKAGQIMNKSGDEFSDAWKQNEKSLEELRNKYNGNPPKQIVESKNAPVTPDDLQPAFKAGGKVFTNGSSHSEIIENAKNANPNLVPDILEAQVSDPDQNINRGFVDKNGKWYSRNEATDALNKSNPDLKLAEPLQSHHLADLKAKSKPAEIPLGLNRPNLTDESLSKMTDDEFDSHFKNAKQSVNAAEKQLDDAFDAGNELTPEQRKGVATAQDVWSAADNERFRRNNSDTHTEDIFHKMIDLADVGNDYSKFKILADILTKRGGAKPKDVTAIYNSLPERLKANPDFKEALSGKLGKFKEWLQKYHSEKSPKVEGAPEKVSEAKEPAETIETTPLDPATGNPVEPKADPVQKFRVGRSPQLYSMVNKLPQSEIEKSNGEQAVTVKNEKTGETYVVMESDLTPVKELSADKKGKKTSIEDKLKSLGYTVGQIKAMSKAGAKALADRGQEIIGMGGAIPAEFTDANRDIYGIAERVRRQRENAEMTAPTAPGKGIAPEASVDRGRQLLKAGADPEKVMSDFEKTQRASSDDFAIARAHGETLARITNRTEENFGTDSPEFRAAYKAESDWAARTKAMQTEWAKSGHAQQGETDIDTGTFLGIKRAYRDSHDGHDLPEKYNEKAQRLADENRRLENENARLLKQLNDKLEKEVPPVDKLVPEMAPTVENTRAALSDYKGGEMTKPQVRALWNYTRKNYVNKGNADFSDIVRKVSTDLGMSFKDVANGLAQPAGAKKLTDELWRKQTDARRVKESAKRWVRQINSPILGNIIPWLARKHFGAKVFGHGGVAFGTHAPMVAFIPKYWKTYFQDYKKMWVMNFSPARYEMEVQSLRSDPNFNTAARAGLVNDPYKVEDFNNPDMTGVMGSSGTAGKVRKFYDTVSQSGNRGYFALKLLRQDMFNQGWDTLPESIKTPEMAKAMADDINHITGVVKSSVGGNKASLFFFAPRLLMSRAAFLAGDPYKAVEIATTAMSPAKWKALPPEQKFHVINQVKQKATILAVAYGLLEANKYLLQAVGSKQQINTTDPTRSDFMKFKGAGMDFSYGNAMLNMARLPVRLWTIGEGDGGKLKHVIYPDESMYSAAGEFLRSQASPLAGLGLDLIFKGDYQNRPLPQIPGYGAPIPVPKRLKAQGVGPYTWPEFFAQQVSPIPFQEAEREIWRSGFGLSDEQQKSLLKAAGTTMVMMGTGGRLTEDLQPH